MSTPLLERVSIQPSLDGATGECIVLWDDVLQALKSALYIRNGSTPVPFLMDESCQILNPRRILTCPETILDVVLETPDNIDCDPESTTAENSADISQPSPVAESDEGSVLINAAAENMKVPNQEDPNSQYNQGTMYYSGNGIPQDYSKAWEWCLKTANQGYANAQFSLGFMFSNGKGVPQDYPKAMGGYFKAADQGHINSQNREGWV